MKINAWRKAKTDFGFKVTSILDLDESDETRQKNLQDLLEVLNLVIGKLQRCRYAN